MLVVLLSYFFILEAHPLGNLKEVEELVVEKKAAGVFFTGVWQEELLLKWVQALKEKSPDVQILMDVEKGVGQRVANKEQLPLPGYLDETTDFFALGVKIGQEAKRLGVTLCLAPVLDVPKSFAAFIGRRAFAIDPEVVAQRGALVIQGIQSTGVGACAKHFPGHGKTATDSHYALPFLSESPKELAEDLLPFKKAIEVGVEAIMLGHLMVPAWDASLPMSLSPKAFEMLRNEMGFKGIILTDDMLMKALATFSPPKPPGATRAYLLMYPKSNE